MKGLKREMIPSWEDLQKHKEIIPEINPAAVIAMLRIKQAAEEIQQGVLDVLQSEHHLSEGKFCVLVVLHQHQTGIAPSVLAEKVGVTRATISSMLQRLERDGLVAVKADKEDARSKKVKLTGVALALPAGHQADGKTQRGGAAGSHCTPAQTDSSLINNLFFRDSYREIVSLHTNWRIRA